MKEIKFSAFVRKYKMEYHLGRIIGEDAFVFFFGYLHPIIPFNELMMEDVVWLLRKQFLF